MSTDYITVCKTCKANVFIRSATNSAIEYDPVLVAELLVTRISCHRKRTKRGDRWGLYKTVTWLCPLCGQAHVDKFWTPDAQLGLGMPE